MTILSGVSIGTIPPHDTDNSTAESLPWIALKEAEVTLDEANRWGDSLSVASAQFAVDDARLRCAALFGELFVIASNTDGVRVLLHRLINRLEPCDGAARDHAAAVARAVDDNAGRLHRLAQENWDIGRWLVQLETRIDRLEMETVNHAA